MEYGMAGNLTNAARRMIGPWSRGGLLLAGAILLTLPWACSSETYLQEADEEVYDIISEKQRVVLGDDRPFAIEDGERIEDIEAAALATYEGEDLEEAGENEGGDDVVGSSGDTAEIRVAAENRLNGSMDPMQEHCERLLAAGIDPDRPVEVDLKRALEVAFLMNRDYQSQKENLYLEALSLTFQRHLWTPIFSGKLSGGASRNSNDQRFVDGDASFSFSQLLSTGGEVGMSIASDILHFYSPDSDTTSGSLFSFNFFQPLWRGAGSLVAEENLTQAERNVAYEVRSLERYRKTFAVNIATSYYEVLQQYDTVANEKYNYESLKENRERSEALAVAGRLPSFQVDQAEQNELSAKNRWIRAEERLDNLLDRFKIDLGLPTDVVLLLDQTDLTRLSEKGLDHPDYDLEAAVHFALENRLDYLNDQDNVEDARRRVLIAKDGLGPDLDFSFDYSVGTDDGNRTFRFDTNHPSYGVGLSMDLPLDRKSERNAFRQSLITLERQKRSLTLAQDNIKQQVRDSYRSLNQAKESYEIQKIAVKLATKRVESTQLLLDAGRVETRDVLDSQADELDAKNALTSAIVDHTIAKMNFLLDIEALSVSDRGAVESRGEEKIGYRKEERDESADEERTGA